MAPLYIVARRVPGIVMGGFPNADAFDDSANITLTHTILLYVINFHLFT